MIFFAICLIVFLFEDLHDFHEDRKQCHQLFCGQSAALLLRAASEKTTEEVGSIQSAALLSVASLHKGDQIRQLESVCERILLNLCLLSLAGSKVQKRAKIQPAACLIAGNQRGEHLYLSSIY